MDPETGRIYHDPTPLDRAQKNLVGVSKDVANLVGAGSETRLAELKRQVEAAEPKEATCRGCGCTDSAGCTLEGGAMCSWIWVNRETGQGLCTGCRR